MSHDGPSSGEPEFLSSGDPTAPRERRPRPRRRVALLGGGVVALVGLIGGAAWAWSAYSSTGPQPSEALPADTLGYAAVDLDPSGKQKIEAVRLLRKFPGFRDEVDLGTDDDVRRTIIEQVLEENGCDVDYGADIEPWLGMRFAVAALPGDEQPDPVLVLQVTDPDAADEGLSTVSSACGGDEAAAWAIRDEWAVVAETDEVAESAADAATEGSLADDDDFRQWTEAAGDPGVLTAYAAPAAGPVLSDILASEGSAASSGPGSDGIVPGEAQDALENFGGAGLTVRFADGALEAEAATSGGAGTRYVSESGAEVVSTLPEDTAIALGFGLEEGWGESLLDRLGAALGADADDALGFAESSLGLELPEDLETLLGSSAALSLGGDVDFAALEADANGQVPAGAKIRGDAGAIEDILAKLRAAAGSEVPQAAAILQADAADDVVAVGPDDDYREQLLGDGGLGDTDVFQDVVRESDRAGVVLFANFDAGDWVSGLGEQEPEVAENLEPLEAAGVSTWKDGDEGHLLFRLTTE